MKAKQEIRVGLVVIEVEPVGEGDLWSRRQQHLGLALAASELRLSIISKVSVPWLTFDPRRGRQARCTEHCTK